MTTAADELLLTVRGLQHEVASIKEGVHDFTVALRTQAKAWHDEADRWREHAAHSKDADSRLTYRAYAEMLDSSARELTSLIEGKHEVHAS